MFTTGLTWLQGEIGKRRAARRQRQSLIQAVEEVVEIADPIIRLARHYQKALLPSVETAISYCHQLVQALPGPVRLSRASYDNDPRVKALFLSVADLTDLIERGGKGVPAGSGTEISALLTMTKTEKTIYGHKQQGEMLLGDVAMRAVTFSDHRLVALTPDLAAAKVLLAQRSLAILATAAMEKIAGLRADLAELRERRARLSAMQRILLGRSRSFEGFIGPDLRDAAKVGELQELLRQTDEEIVLSRKGLETPDDTLGHLQRTLAGPNEIFRLREDCLRLNWMNVIAEEGDEIGFEQINLAELILNETLRRSALLVCFDRPH